MTDLIARLGVTKVCRKCLIDKPVEAFGKNTQGRCGVRAVCNDCRRLASRANYSANRESIRAKNRDWYRWSAVTRPTPNRPSRARTFCRLTCKACNKGFNRELSREVSRIKRGFPGPFCGKACAQKARHLTGKFKGSPRVLSDLMCPACGVQFRPANHRTKYCGRSCAAAARQNPRKVGVAVPQFPQQVGAAEPSPLDLALAEALR